MIMRCDLASRTLIASMAILAIASLVILAPPTSADKPVVPDEPTVTDYTIYGFVYNVSDQVNIPMENVKVKLLDAGFVTYTDANGRFEFTYTEGQGKYLAFEYTGYTVRSLPDSMELYAEDVFSFDLTGIEPDQDGKYALTTADDAYHTIGMRATNGILFGYVKGIKGSNTFDIENAEVTMVSDTGQSYKTSTNSDGYFEMKDIPYGTYTVRASCNGFGTSEPIRRYDGDRHQPRGERVRYRDPRRPRRPSCHDGHRDPDHRRHHPADPDRGPQVEDARIRHRHRQRHGGAGGGRGA